MTVCDDCDEKDEELKDGDKDGKWPGKALGGVVNSFRLIASDANAKEGGRDKTYSGLSKESGESDDFDRSEVCASEKTKGQLCESALVAGAASGMVRKGSKRKKK